MHNSTILLSLEENRDQQLQSLKEHTLSEVFRMNYESITGPNTTWIGGIDHDYISEAKALCEKKDQDHIFSYDVEKINELDKNSIILHFIEEVKRMLSFIAENQFEKELQAIFIEYDYYYHYTAGAAGYGKQEYPLVTTPRYISNEYDYNIEVFIMYDAISFKPAWPNFADYEWAAPYIDPENELITLYKLNSRVLLHEALQLMALKGEMDFLNNRPFSFFINEHDCEVMSLFRLE